MHNLIDITIEDKVVKVLVGYRTNPKFETIPISLNEDPNIPKSNKFGLIDLTGAHNFDWN